ncbi:hypothetical protein [Paenibacillus sp. FSL R5-0486]|uniref:hypothetical protein n=1 Tax=Paenibacillus sp. FSL R5-0486 TaxID=2921645 RepID=UPI0030DA8A42
MTNQDVKFWRYYIPSVDGEGWGIFILDSTGMFSAVTDYGNAAHKFEVREGEDIRKYLAKGVPGTLMARLFYDLRRYDPDETLRRAKQDIIYLRGDQSLTREEARKEWDLLQECDWLENEAGFVRWFDQTSISDAGENHALGYPASCRAFVNELMPRFCAALAEEFKQKEIAV